MNYNFIPTDLFKREFKRLAKRYKSLKQDLEDLYNEMEANPQLGTDLDNGIRKIRMSIKSKNKGRSGGARIITFTVIVSESDTEINILYIYDKSEQSSISKKDIETLLVKSGLK